MNDLTGWRLAKLAHRVVTFYCFKALYPLSVIWIDFTQKRAKRREYPAPVPGFSVSGLLPGCTCPRALTARERTNVTFLFASRINTQRHNHHGTATTGQRNCLCLRPTATPGRHNPFSWKFSSTHFAPSLLFLSFCKSKKQKQTHEPSVHWPQLARFPSPACEEGSRSKTPSEVNLFKTARCTS